MSFSSFLRPLSVSALASLALTTSLTTAAHADTGLPAPYVSRALDAVLLPINKDVRAAFQLSPKDKGVLVLAVEPKGVAAKNGIEPGDVIAKVGGKKVSKPIQIDEIVYYWITAGTFDFLFDGYRAGSGYSVSSLISEDLYLEVIDISTVESWSAWSSEEFSYSEYYSEYSSEFSASYESSESIIEETATSEEFAAEVSDSSTDEMTSEDGDDSSAEAEDAGDDEDMSADDASDEDMSADEGTDDEAVAEDEAGDDEAAVEEDGGDDEAMAEDDAGDDEAAAEDDGGDDMSDDGGDDSGGDDGGDDSGGDDSGGDDGAVEE